MQQHTIICFMKNATSSIQNIECLNSHQGVHTTECSVFISCAIDKCNYFECESAAHARDVRYWLWCQIAVSPLISNAFNKMQAVDLTAVVFILSFGCANEIKTLIT